MKPKGDIMLQVAADKEGDDFVLKHTAIVAVVISSYRDVKSDVIGTLHSNGLLFRSRSTL